MYLDHFGLSEHPFRITPHTDFFYNGADRGAILSALIYAAEHEEGIIKVTGEVGSGKTMLCRMLMEKLPENVVSIYLANPSLNRDEILYAIADDLGLDLPANSRTAVIIKAIQDCLIALYGKGQRVVLLVDEAHAMPSESLEEIRLLSNLESNRHKLLQIILFGQQELDATLHLSTMRPLRERITQNFTLQPWHHHDIGAYIAFRLRAANYQGPDLFDKPALAAIAKASRGLTRRINILADKSLLAAYASGLSSIGLAQVKLSIKDARYDFQNSLYKEKRSWLHKKFTGKVALLTLSGLGLLCVVLFFLLADFEKPPPAPPPAAVSVQPTPQPISKHSLPINVAEPVSQPAKVSGLTSHPPTQASTAVSPNSPQLDNKQAENATTPRESNVSLGEKITPTPSFDPYTQGLSWIRSAGEGYSIQLMLIKEANSPQGRANVQSLIKTLAARAGPNFEVNKLMFFTNLSAEIQRLGVTYGQFKTREEAALAHKTLPESVRPANLQIRSKSGLKTEIGERAE